MFRSLVRAADVGHELEVELFEALQRKDTPALKTLTKRVDAKTRAALLPALQAAQRAEPNDLTTVHWARP